MSEFVTNKYEYFVLCLFHVASPYTEYTIRASYWGELRLKR